MAAAIRHDARSRKRETDEIIAQLVGCETVEDFVWDVVDVLAVRSLEVHPAFVLSVLAGEVCSRKRRRWRCDRRVDPASPSPRGYAQFEAVAALAFRCLRPRTDEHVARMNAGVDELLDGEHLQ